MIKKGRNSISYGSHVFLFFIFKYFWWFDYFRRSERHKYNSPSFHLMVVSVFIISQILAGIAFVPALMSFQFKKREHILLLLVCSASLMSVHFFLLDQITASLIALLGAGRMFLARKFALEKMMLIFLLLNMIVLFITYQQPVNLLAFLATTCFTYANFRKDDKSLRLVMMLGTTIWIIHNALVGSPVGVLIEASFLTGNIVGYYRHYGRNK